MRLSKSPRHKETIARALLALGGVALGVLLAPYLWPILTPQQLAPGSKALPPPATPRPADTAAKPLELVQVAIQAADLERLAAQRGNALQAGVLLQDPDFIVPVSLRYGTETAIGTARLKGDWTDHLDTDQWSLRFELQTPLRGMRKFSVQHPKTRGHTMEWFVMQTARRIGVLAPRTDFVRVAINGEEKGVYYLEEHASKELLEAQGRREGAIVRFDESARWATILQYGFHRTGIPGADLWRTQWVLDSVVDGYDERRLLSNSALSTRLLRAIDLARDIQRTIVATAPGASTARQLLALRRLEGRTIEDIFDTDALGRWLALHTLFRAFHGVVWIQWRFYHDPVRDRLEPIVFDTGADLIQRRGEVVLDSPDIRWLRSSDTTMAATFAELGRLTTPEFLESLLSDLLPEVRRFDRAMIAAGSGEPGLDLASALDVLLREQVTALRNYVRPQHAIALHATLAGVRMPSGEDLRTIEIEAWARTGIATLLTGFQFRNGRIVPATDALIGVSTLSDSALAVTAMPDGSVVLPPDGKRLRFRFAIDRRLADLSEIAALKRAIRRQVESQRGERVEVDVLYRPAAESVNRREPLTIRRTPEADAKTEGRPKAPNLAEALDVHSFLKYDLATRKLIAQPGVHQVQGDLLLPLDYALELAPGCTLLLSSGAVAVIGALQAPGTPDHPVVIRAADPDAGWAGMLVMGTAGKSSLQHVTIRDAHEIRRGGWHCTGGITFLDSEVELLDCHFAAGHGEDLINLIGVRFRCERCRFQGGPSDLLDGDFVTGTITDCDFSDSGEDAVDMSGSVVEVRNCRFARIGDKAFSVGEASHFTISDCLVDSSSIAIAVKDRSIASVDRLEVRNVTYYVAAVYIKKPEFGPSQLELKNLRWGGSNPAKHLVQHDCVMMIDGEVVATETVDVEDLYRRQILGK